MSSQNLSFEQRHHVRYQPKDSLFVSIQGDCFDNPACVADLSRNGVGFYSARMDNELIGKVIVLDLVSGPDRAILRLLSARIDFSREARQLSNDSGDSLMRCGLQFINLSALEKRQLDLITKKYALSE